MSLIPKHAADCAAAAAAHLWHLTFLLGGMPGRRGPVDQWRDVAVELTVLSERLRAAEAGRRVVPFDDGRGAHVAAIRAAMLELLATYQNGPPVSQEPRHGPFPAPGSQGRAG